MRPKGIGFEVLFAAAVLLVAGAITVMMFVKANVLQDKARDLDRAVLAAQAAIEEWKAGHDSSGVYYYDSAFEAAVSPVQDGFVMEVTVTGDGGLYEITVAVTRAKPYFGEMGTEVFSVQTSVYRGERG